MASQQMLRLGATAVAAGLGGTAALFPIRTVYAEDPQREVLGERKSIYPQPATVRPSKPPRSDEPPRLNRPPVSTTPTPTDRVAEQVKRTRLFIYDQSLRAENGVNQFMSYALQKETSFTGTVASLAPGRETGEKLLPGAIYVLVAAMTGSIITRNRGLFLRTTFPLAVGITAGWTLIPVTMRNIADLSWEYERRIPLISNTHAEIRGFTEEAVRQTRVHAQLVKDWAEEKAGTAREKAESWVSDGK